MNLLTLEDVYIKNYQKVSPEEVGNFLPRKPYKVLFLDIRDLAQPSLENDPSVQNREYECVAFVIDERGKLCAINLFACDIIYNTSTKIRELSEVE